MINFFIFVFSFIIAISADTTKIDTILTERAITDLSICIVSGNVNISRCWKSYYGGSVDSQFIIIRTSDKLKEFWDSYNLNSLERPYDCLPKLPTINFNEKMIIIVMPGAGPILYDYSINLIEKVDTIQVVENQYKNSIDFRNQGKIRPVLIYEIPRTNKIFSWKIIRQVGREMVYPK
jgi:hypothetical protein